MVKAKFDPETRGFLKEAYVNAVAEFGGEDKVTKTFNDQFFARMLATEALQDFTIAQLRGSLGTSQVYIGTEKRAEPKKKGVRKADLIDKLHKFLPDELTSAMKLTMVDLEILITAFEQAYVSVEEAEALVEEAG